MGIRPSTTHAAATLASLIKTRLELFSLEAADEKTRFIKLLGLAFAALLFLTFAVLTLSVWVAVAFWPTDSRHLALGGLAALYALIGLGLLAALRRTLVAAAFPFAITLSELGRDAQALARVQASADSGDEDHDSGARR